MPHITANDKTLDPGNYPIAQLVDEANRHGVTYLLPMVTNAHYTAGRLMIWNCRNPDGQRIVDAMRARRDEVAAFLRAHRPAPLTVSAPELRYRRAVLHEPDDDLPLSEVPMMALRAIIAGVVLDILNAERADEERQRERRRAEDAVSSTPPTQIPKQRKSSRRTAHSDRVVY